MRDWCYFHIFGVKTFFVVREWEEWVSTNISFGFCCLVNTQLMLGQLMSWQKGSSDVEFQLFQL